MIKYNKNTCTVDMSVGTLCELVAKSGSIDSRYRTTVAHMIAGGEIHRRLQAEAGGLYTPEVELVNTTLFGGMYYTVSGRADGIIRGESGICVDEIKSVRGYDFYQPPKNIHIAQLKCYAYFLCVRDGLEKIGGRITYFNRDNEKIKYFKYSFRLDELREFYLGLLEKAEFFARLEANRALDVLPACAKAVFPYAELREGQEMMIRECYGAIKRGQRLFVEAPTGTGKTISSLFPSVRALGEGYADKIFYLTAKASTRREAYGAAAKLFSSGLGIRAVVLNSKESMCKCKKKAFYQSARNCCDPDNCEYACGYYDKVNAALKELLESSNGYPAKAIAMVAEKYGICPYELSLDLSEYCDIIICDYNYVFDPSVYLRRYFADGGRGEKYVLLADEAHNLADRARDMYSCSLKMSDFSALALKAEETDGALAAVLNTFCQELLKLKRLCRDNITKDSEGNERGFFMSRAPLGGFGEAMESFRRSIDGWLRKNPASELYDEAYALTSQIRKYQCVSEYFDKGFLCYVEVSGGDITVKTYCLDPARVMNSLLGRAKATVMFSATLTPMEYFLNVLGCSKSGVSVTLPSPFDPERLCVAVADYLSVRYEDRAGNISAYVSVIAATVSAKAGNYMVYLPSYDCLQKVHKLFSRKYPQVTTVVQDRNMNMHEREEFLSQFKADEGRLRVGFCVLGGAFSEGVDLPGSRLIGSIIIGVGLPGLSNERNIIRDYYDEDTENGYDYAYTFPGMNNVLQAAGRVIRTESDRGIVVLADDRYASPTYRRLFPEHWKNIQYAGNSISLAEIARRFWKNKVNFE